MPVEHYENFPVASFLLPRRMRRPIEAIYRFARGADDIADEGEAMRRSACGGLPPTPLNWSASRKASRRILRSSPNLPP